MLPNERRRYHRKNCCCSVDLDDYEQAYSGRLRNLGLGGAYIDAVPDKTFSIGQDLILTIPYEHKAGHLMIKGKVAWKNGSGLGVAFVKAPVKRFAPDLDVQTETCKRPETADA